MKPHFSTTSNRTKITGLLAPIDANLRKLAISRNNSRFRHPVSEINPFKDFLARKFFQCLPVLTLALVCGTARADDAAPIFPKVRALSLSDVRQLAMKRSPALALSGAKIGAAQADLKDVSRRLKLDTTGGLDPFSREIRFYLALDLERLAGLNRAEKESARQKVEAEKIAARGVEQDAMKRVSSAWYSLASAQMAVESAGRRKETARALYVAADAKFKAGSGELSGVLSALSGQSEAADAFQSARQSVALACLELAQSCGFLTAEEFEKQLQ